MSNEKAAEDIFSTPKSRYEILRDAYNARRPEVQIANEALRGLAATGPGSIRWDSLRRLAPPQKPWFLRTFMPCIMAILKALLVIFLIFWVLTFVVATLTGVAALFILVF